jgi:transposase InsO family protein
VKVDPFIEAEEAAGHSVKHCCELFEVSRAAYYERKKAIPSKREVSDVELAERIADIHTTSKGTYGSPRIHAELRRQGVGCGRRRVRRLMRRAGLEGRCKKRWRKTTVPDPASSRRRTRNRNKAPPRAATSGAVGAGLADLRPRVLAQIRPAQTGAVSAFPR